MADFQPIYWKTNWKHPDITTISIYKVIGSRNWMPVSEFSPDARPKLLEMLLTRQNFKSIICNWRCWQRYHISDRKSKYRSVDQTAAIQRCRMMNSRKAILYFANVCSLTLEAPNESFTKDAAAQKSTNAYRSLTSETDKSSSDIDDKKKRRRTWFWDMSNGLWPFTTMPALTIVCN